MVISRTKPGMRDHLAQRAMSLKAQVLGLYLAARDSRTPWYVRLLVLIIVAYALSPIDLIPDFIPVVGYLDDLVLLPLLIAVAVKATPEEILRDCRERAEAHFSGSNPVSRVAGIVVVVCWAALIGLLIWVLLAQAA
jgi:uncharacterized membrane protein YkvA (DUF1232 family)